MNCPKCWNTGVVLGGVDESGLYYVACECAAVNKGGASGE